MNFVEKSDFTSIKPKIALKFVKFHIVCKNYHFFRTKRDFFWSFELNNLLNWIIYWIESQRFILNWIIYWIESKWFILNWIIFWIEFSWNNFWIQTLNWINLGIQIRVPPGKKSCFWGSFLQKTASHDQTVQFWLDSVIHRWKALDLSFLMVFLKKYFATPAKCPNFVDASGQIFSLILRPCHMHSTLYKYVCMYVMLCNILKYVIQP